MTTFMETYNLIHRGVVCTGVDWTAIPYNFYLIYRGEKFMYSSPLYQIPVELVADTDCIRKAIDLFLEERERINRLNQVLVSSDDCTGCRWLGKRQQKCSCCCRNKYMKDCYEAGSN